MAFEDLIVGGDDADEPTAIVSPDLIATRNERKGLTDVSARARQPVDFGTDDEVIGPAPKASQQTIDFGTDDEVIGSAPVKNPPMPRARPAEADAISGPVPMPRPRPAEAPGLIQPTQPMPEVQPLDNAPFRAPSSGMDTNMLTGEEAYAERQASISGAQAGVAEAQARLDAALARQGAVAAPAARRGTTGGLQRQAIDAEVENARANLDQAQQALSAAERAAPPTQTKTRDAASRFATAVGTTIPDVIGGIARPIDAGLDAVGIEGGTGIAEKMRGISRKVGLENQPDPAREEELTALLGQGGGSAVGFIVTGAIGKAAKIPAAFASGGAGAAQNAEQYYREADDMGAPAYKKALAYAVGAGIGSTEAIGLGRIADELDKKTGGGLKRYFGLIMKEMGEEGLQEAGQQLLDNLAKFGLYGKDPGDITNDVARNALVGMILGGGMAGTLGLGNLTAGRDRAAREGVPTPDQATVTPEEIIRQILGEPSTPPATQPMPGPAPGMPASEPAPSQIEEPPVPPQQAQPEETVRFYHGGKYGEEQGPADGSPKWLTPDEAYARDYKSDGKPNEVYFVDIPKSQIPPDGFDDINGRYRHFNAPEGIAGQLKPLVEKAPTKAEAKAASDEDTALLRGYGYTDEQIADMSANQRQGEIDAAKEAGTEPVFGDDDAVVGSRSEPVKVESAEDLKHVTNHVADDYTPAQGEANNRQLGHMTWNGLDASIEAGPGQGRKWLNKKTGETGETVSPAAIGYFKGTVGGDGMHLDVYFGSNPASKNVWVVDEQDGETGKWRQHKVMAGFDTEQEARDAYLGTSSKSEKTLSAITPMSVDELKDWIAKGDLKKPLVTTKAVTPRQQPKASEPMSLLQFIASKGGLAPDSELTAIGATGSHRVNVPGRTGRFPVVRATGMSLDQMREAAEEAGYFRGTGEATSTPREFLDAVDNELRGQRRLPEGQEAEPSKRDTQRLEEENANRDALLTQNRAEIEAMLEAYGVPAGMTNEADLKLAAEIMADEDLDPDAALERAAIRNLENDPDIPQETVYDAFDFGAFDAVQPQPTPEDERVAEAAGAAGVRPGEEGRADEPVEHLSGAGEDRQGPGQGEAREEAERAEQPSEEVPERVAPSEEEQTRASRAMDAALDKIEEAVEADDRKAVLQAGRDARKVLADTPQAIKDAEPEYWDQFKRTISDMLKPGYVTGEQAAKAARAKAGIKDDGKGIVKGDGFETLFDVDGYAYRTPKGPLVPGFKTRAEAKAAASVDDRAVAAKIERAKAAEEEYDRKTAEQNAHSEKIAEQLRAGGTTFGPYKIEPLTQDRSGIWQTRIKGNSIDVPQHGFAGGDKDHFIDVVLAPYLRGLVDRYRELNSTTETGADGKQQTVIPGAEKASDKTMAQRKADQPLKPKAAQKPADEGLFGDDSKQTDLLDLKPTEQARESGPSASDDLDIDSIIDQAIDKYAPETASTSALEVASPDDINPNRPVKIGTVYRGTEAGITQAEALRASASGDLGSGVYVSPNERIASSYGGGPRASVAAGTRMVHRLEVKPLQPHEVAYLFGGRKVNENISIIRGDDALLYRGPYSGKTIEDVLSRVEGVKALVGTPDSVGLNQIAIRDPSIVEGYVPPEPKTKKRTAGKAAKSAAKNTAMGLAEVAKGLDALFSPKGKLGSGPTFDDETYAKAKPFFMAGVAHFAEAGRDIKAMLDELVKHLVQTAGMGREAIVAMRPYLKQFAQDVASGAIDLSQQETDNGAAESADERSGTEIAGQEALDGVSAAEGGGTASAGDVGRGAAGSGDLGADGDRATQEPGLSGERGAGSGPAEVHPPAAGADRGRAGARAGGKRGRVSEAPAGTDRSGGEPAGPVTPAEAPNLPALNYRITDETELGQGSEGVKFRDNIAAIETLKTIERENRRATPAEQRALARYVGWGGLANAFRDTDGNLKPDWKDRGEQLESLLTKDELAAARRSTRNAHYTSHTIVDAMWEAARHLGFKGGLALELSSGTGNFLGLVPEEIAGNTRFVAVEFDSITARIAKALYPQDTVLHSGLHKLPLPEGEAVLNIGNPPFGSESLRFQYKPELNGLSIHNQFFLAGLDALQPGGLQILVVSRYLMDAQDTRAREMLAKKAKLLGAIRLPDTAFKENARTEVVTDILFLQRHTKAEEEYAAEQFENAKDERKVSDIPDWVHTGTVRDPLGGEPMVVNSYFARKPNMVMGKLERSGSMRSKDEVNVTLAKGADLSAMLRKAIQTLPRNVLDIHQDVMDATLKRYKTMGESLEIALAGHEIGHVEQTDGKLYQISERETPTGGYEPVKRAVTPDSPWSRQLLMDAEGRWYTLEPKVDEKGAKVKSGARNVYERKYFEGNVVPAAMRLGKAKYDKLKALVNLRDLTKRQLTLEAEDAPAAEMEGNRKKLADAYQAFVGSNGYLNDAGNLRLLNDLPDGALVLALETGYRAPVTHAKAARTAEAAKPASAKPAPIMSRRVVPKYEPATKAASPQDALSISLSEVGHADMDRIAQLLGKSREEAIEELTAGDKPLLYKDPETGAYETANGYLTGNVVRKLKAAEAAGITKNVEALQKVQPERWSAENISAMPGANWIPPQVYADFASHLFGVPAKVHYSQVTNSFNLYVDDYSREKADQWGTADMTADAILRGILNSRVPKVIREDGEGRKYVDQEATALVSLKAKEVENEFADWVFADSARRNLLTDIYNEKFNTRVNRQHDGSHLTLPGKVPDEVIKLRRHQKNAVWRGIYERFMLLDHVVGAGKTFTAIARVMERRRMGLSRKPMIVVPNHLVDQWTADVYRLYPGAKVLAAGKNQFEKKGRRRLFAKIATGDWDVVIVPHSSFGFIGISPETESRFLEEELRIAKEAVQEAQDQAAADGIGGRSKPFTVKEAERLVTTIEGRLDSLKKAGRDNMLTFEQMGVDDLTVDEAHEFKNLFYSSRLTGVRGMGDKSGSQKAFDLYNKVRVLRDSPNGTVTFMTGTPISNSAVEMYTMMRYLSAQDLKDLGIEHFDAWRSQYVSAAAKFEPTEAGGLKEVTRLGRNWSNMRALMELYYSFTDAVSQEDINRWYAEDNNGARFPVPKVKTGGRKEVVVKPTDAQSAMLRGIVAGFNGLPNISDPYERNAERLKLMDRARKVSLDARAADATVQSDEAGGKLDQIADKIADIYDRTTGDAGTQLVFIDRSVPAAKSDKKVIKDYDDLIGRRDAALAAGDEAKYRDLVEQLEKFDANEIETLRAAQKGGWNAYDQLKANLTARGIPADEIRFVQEANNDAEKKALFDAVNDGTVRVLIGSTPRMGAGTNVQERLVALHHGDVTWKPSDIEQREGRIIRQGNKLLEKYGADNFEVDILAYVTERTVDAKMWDLNATKLKMINGIRKYDGAFNMEFEDEDSVGMAEIAALASGDPLLLERVKLIAEIDKLELLERAHRRKMFGIDDAIYDLERAQKNYPAMIEAGKAKAAVIQSAIDTVRRDAASRTVEVEGKSYSTRLDANNAVEAAIEVAKAGDENARYAISINGHRVTNREMAQALLNEAIGDPVPIEAVIDGDVVRSRTTMGQIVARKATELLHQTSRDAKKPVRIGKMLGYNLELGVYPDAHRISLALTDNGATIVDVEQAYSHDAKGFVPQSGRALIDKLESETDYEASFTGRRLQDKLNEAETRLPSLREERGKPFAKAEDLSGLRDRLEEVIKTLDQRTKDAESGRLTDEQASIARYSIVRRSSSLTGAEIEAAELLQQLQLPHGRFWADYTKLAKKHPEVFTSPEQVRQHVESVMSDPDLAIPQRSGNVDLVKRSDVDRLIGFRAHLKNGRYTISTAYVLEPGQLERMKSGAAHAGATVLELSSKDHLSGQGRVNEYNRAEGARQAVKGLSPERRTNLERALTDVVRKIAGPSVAVRFVDEHPINMPKGWGSFGQDKVTAAGSYIPAQSLITVALADPAYPLEQVLDTTFHEAFHALEDKILTEQEMDVLKREDARLREIVKRAYGFTDEQIGEIAGFEIRAMAFEYYASRRAKGLEPQGLHIGIRRAFERLLDLFRRVRNALNGLGYRNASDIFEAAYDGAYADRRAAVTASVTEQANVRPQGNLNRFESYEPLPERWQDWWKRPDLNWRDRAWGMLDAAFLRANRALGDRYVDMRRLQAAVELTGRQVNEGINMALAATLFEGRTEKRLKDYWIKLWKPALDFAYSQGVTREELHRYLYARHAPERNAHIAEINPLMPEGGSGMTDAEAQEIMDGFAAAGKLEALEQVAQQIDGIVRKIRSMMVDDQLEHEETIGQWEQAYQHYVPLRGFESGDEDMAQDLQVSRAGKGFDVRGPETKQALGRSSKADDVLTSLFLMGERTIIRGEQNRVGRTAMRFMQSNPQPSLYEVSRSERVLTDGRVETTTENDIDLLAGERPVTVRRVNRETGLVETVTRVASSWANDSFAVKVGGHTYYIRIKHPGLLTALKNVGIQRLPWLIQAHSWLTRQFSAFRTARNPDFFVPNLFRDVQDAAYTLGAEQRTSLVKNFALNIGTLRTYVAAFMGELMEKDGALGDLARRKFADKRGAQLYEDWKKHGGQIAFMGINDLDSARREIEAAFHETEESYATTVAKAPLRLARSILKAVEFFNGAIEAGTRLAVYDAGLKAGMTKNKAAELSKESTTNFNRKGIYSPYLNAFYAFFNARVQGATKIIRLLRNSKMARRAAIGLVVGGFATTLWNLAVSPDDEDKKPEYMRRKYWERERYFIFYFPGAKDPIRIPMGYGLQVFWMLGENLAMASQGKITPAQAAANYLSTIVSAFSPLQAEGSASDPGTWLRYIMPSMEMPLLELGTNEDWRRKPIHPKYGKKGEPHSEQHFSTTSPYAIDVAQFLNKVSGGNAFKPGAVDLYPGDLQYIWNFATGGLGQTTNRTSTMFNNWLEGVPTPPNQVPILRHFVGANVEQATGEAYYEARDEVQRGMAQVRKALKAPAASDDAAKTIEEGANRFGVHQGRRRGTVSSDAETAFRNADKKINGLRALEQATRQDKTMDSKTRSETIADLRKQMREVQEEARKAYREIKKREPTF